MTVKKFVILDVKPNYLHVFYSLIHHDCRAVPVCYTLFTLSVTLCYLFLSEAVWGRVSPSLAQSSSIPLTFHCRLNHYSGYSKPPRRIISLCPLDLITWCCNFPGNAWIVAGTFFLFTNIYLHLPHAWLIITNILYGVWSYLTTFFLSISYSYSKPIR